MTREKKRLENDEKIDILKILSQMMSKRDRLARTMISNKIVSNEKRRQVIENLCSLVFQDFQKRKRQNGDIQKLRPPKRNQGSPGIDRRTELSPRESLDRKAVDKMDTTSSHPSSEIVFVSRAAEDTRQNLSKLTYDESNSSSEIDE
ncbi:MAG: hypothetical protein Q9191_007925 [Dirinaria sp. TL-2023a]